MKSPVRHIAIIMDGNGRWAQKRNHARAYGHVKGAQRVREVTRACSDMKIEALTLYTFSTENWQRPRWEVNFLMKLLYRYILSDRKEIMENNIRFRTVGFNQLIPKTVLAEMERLQKDTVTNTGMVLTLALSYGSRQEITEAARKIALDVRDGKLAVEAICEKTINDYLFTCDLPEPDLLIRTGGDQRISNFLLWQIAYAELFFVPCAWPDFTINELYTALETFASRERRYGQISSQIQGVSLS